MKDIQELEAALSCPTPAAIDALRGLKGDLVVLGAGGKMGPSLCHMAQRAIDEGGGENVVHAVARFSDPGVKEQLEQAGIRTHVCDLLERDAVAALPDAAAVFFLAGTKFGTATQRSLTWALNALVPGIVGERYAGVPTVVFSSGNVYPFVPITSHGANEDTPPAPLGEYAWSVLARERLFEHFATSRGTPLTIYRLNYAAELRYGVPVDIAQRVLSGQAIDLGMGHFNALWQGDANAMALACLSMASTPPTILNVTGLETVSVRELARRFGTIFEREPVFAGSEQPTALLNDARRAHEQFGPATVSLDMLINAIGAWLRAGGPTHAKPTHYEVRDGAF